MIDSGPFPCPTWGLRHLVRFMAPYGFTPTPGGVVPFYSPEVPVRRVTQARIQAPASVCQRGPNRHI